MISSISAIEIPVNRMIAAAAGSSGAAPTASDDAAVSGARGAAEDPFGKAELTDEERHQVEELQRRDREVRQHEAAHKAAAGRYATGAPTYEYEVGPDGRRYAVGGEVQIDTSEVPDDPQATINKMQAIRRAALAPSEPSAQDRQIAAEAAHKLQQARAELARSADSQAPQTAESNAAQGSIAVQPNSAPGESEANALIAPATDSGETQDAPVQRNSTDNESEDISPIVAEANSQPIARLLTRSVETLERPELGKFIDVYAA